MWLACERLQLHQQLLNYFSIGQASTTWTKDPQLSVNDRGVITKTMGKSDVNSAVGVAYKPTKWIYRYAVGDYFALAEERLEALLAWEGRVFMSGSSDIK